MYNTLLGDTVFTSGPDPITATTNVLNLESSEPVLNYVGVGANAAGGMRLIREDKAHQIYSIMQTSRKLGMRTRRRPGSIV